MAPRVLPFSFEENPIQAETYATIQCTVPQGDFPLNISWRFNNAPIHSQSGILVTAVGRRSSSLTLESVSYNQMGNYTCRGENKAGYAEYTAALMVNGLL